MTYFKCTSNSLVITFYPVVEVCWCQDKPRGNFFTGLVCSELHHHCHNRNRSKYALWLYCWWFSLPLFIRSGKMCKVAVFLLIENVKSRKTRPYTHIPNVLRGGRIPFAGSRCLQLAQQKSQQCLQPPLSIIDVLL